MAARSTGLWTRSALGFVAVMTMALPALARAERVLPERELLIVSPEVTRNRRASGDGPWSLGSQLQRLAQASQDRVQAVPRQPNAALEPWMRSWLSEWERPTMGNGLPAQPRSAAQILDYWPRGESGILWKEMPFQLLGIVFRPDLRSVSDPAGEGRLLYVLVDPRYGQPVDFFVILEFRLPTSRWSAREWAERIHELGSLPMGEAYLSKLEKLTEAFSAEPSNLNSLRTNELILGLSWEIRDFGLDPSTGLARARLMPRTPHPLLSAGEGAKALTQWARENAEQVASGLFELPVGFRTEADIVPGETFRWLAGSGLPEQVRRGLSLQACGACHTGETDTRFVHLFLERVGEAARPSAFLRDQIPERITALEQMLAGGSAPLPARRRTPH